MLADGFEWWEEITKMTSTETEKTTEITNFFIGFNRPGRYILVLEPDDITIWYLYPLLLRRAVEGWPDNLDEYIKTNDYQKTVYLTPQEQAIEACLIELLEK